MTVTVSRHDLENVTDQLSAFIDEYNVSGKVRVDTDVCASLERCQAALTEVIEEDGAS